MNRFFGQTELYSQVLHFPTLVLEVGSLPPEPASSLLYQTTRESPGFQSGDESHWGLNGMAVQYSIIF